MSKRRSTSNPKQPINRGTRDRRHGNQPMRVKIHGITQLREAIPYLLAFVPEHSMVFVGLAPDDTVSITGRIDAPTTAAESADVARAIRTALAHTSVGQIVMAHFGDLDPHADHLAEHIKMRPFALVIDRQLKHDGLMVADWSWADPLGNAEPAPASPPSIALANAIVGRQTFGTRAELIRQVDPLPSGQRVVIAAYLRELPGLELPTTKLSSALEEVIMRDRLAYDSEHGRRPMSAEEIAMWCHALERGVVRDAMLRLIVTDIEPILDAIWLNIMQMAPEDAVAPAAMLYATSMYLSGDGVLARSATDRALRVRPNYAFAATIASALDAGFPPEKFRSLMCEVMQLHDDSAQKLDRCDDEDVIGDCCL